MIPKETIDRIYDAVKIEEVVSDYVTLKKRGANLIGLCPFHDEKTGSFTVSPSKGIYKCFGCGKAGNAVNFVKEIEQCDYYDALRQLARKYHIEIEERQLTAEEQQRQDDRESMFVVNDRANRWFQDTLWNTREGQAIGLSYLRERGVRDDIIRRFQLGYSPEKGNPLSTALRKEGFKEEYLVNNPDTRIGTGICGKSEDGRLYDRFRDRVIFPIHTVSGKTVAFAGRILKKKENTGKYINSPDSIIYSKTNELYGLFLAKQAIARQNLCYLVEGQMDVISMFQAGIENVVASGGTALTKPQIRLIHRFTGNITVLYDGDAAGIHAALRGIDMFLEEGFQVKVLLLPDGEDPDSFARSHNASDFIEYIRQNQTDFIRYKTQLLQDEAKNDPMKRSQLIRSLVESIAVIPDPITRQVYIKDCSEQLGMAEYILSRETARLRRTKREGDQRPAANTNAETSSTPETPFSEPQPQPEEQQQPTIPRTAEDTSFDHNMRNLLQVIVRYGDRCLGDPETGDWIPVGEYIIRELTNDGIRPRQPIQQTIIDEFMQHYREPGFNANSFFVHHTNPHVSQLAAELTADQYQLSKIFYKQSISENVVQEVRPQTDEDILPELTNQLLLELKYTVVNERIAMLQKALQEAQKNNDWERQKSLLSEQPQLLQIRAIICKELGNRVVVN